ncbi:MAG: hypothetical protein ACJ8DU_05950 [Microvirga sp.]
MTKFLSLVGFARRSAGPQIRPSMLMRGHHVDTIKHGGGLKMPRVPLKPLRLLRNFGAGEGIRTLDPNLGKFKRRRFLEYPNITQKPEILQP